MHCGVTWHCPTNTHESPWQSEGRRRPDFFYLTILDFLSHLLPTLSLWQVLRVLSYLLSSVTCSKSSELLTYLFSSVTCQKPCCFTHRFHVFTWRVQGTNHFQKDFFYFFSSDKDSPVQLRGRVIIRSEIGWTKRIGSSQWARLMGRLGWDLWVFLARLLVLWYDAHATGFVNMYLAFIFTSPISQQKYHGFSIACAFV